MTADRKLYAKLRRHATSNYSPTSAAAYREADDAAKDTDTHAGKCQEIRDLALRFPRPIDMLDLGCGTGRYFHCVQNVKSLVGVDPSEHMLQHARQPVLGGNRNVHLIRSSVHEVAFAPQAFDLVICVGVLTLWCPLDGFVLERIAEMVRRDGSFFCTLIEYAPVQQTIKRRLASVIQPLLFGAPRRYVDVRLSRFTMPAERVQALGEKFFEQVTITKWRSPTTRVDLHCVMSRPKRRA